MATADKVLGRREVSSFYQSEAKIHAREVTGTFARLRKVSAVVLLGVFYLLPWMPWGERQAVLFDLPARKFYLFGLTLWPQDFIYLAMLLIVAALSLFFFTALAGRLWCGYACPQTVWTEAFVWLEQITEGKFSKRKKLDKGPWTTEKIARKGTKQFLWIAFAGLTGFTFVGYFTPIFELAAKIANFSLGPWEAFWVVFYGFATYGNAGFMREQVCKYMCPYARFQGAMFDKDTLIITYDEARGEPRGHRRRASDPRSTGLGDCIDCTLCVQVCPTGIDIRKGLQHECIACAACIDACDQVMDKIGYPHGLIRYSTEHALEKEKTRVLRPRVIVYAVLLTVMLGALGGSLALRTPLSVDVVRDRNALYRELPNGSIENSYQLKIINKDSSAHRYRVVVAGLDGVMLLEPHGDIELSGGERRAVPASVVVPASAAVGIGELTFTVESLDAPDISRARRARFLGPFATGRVPQ